MSGKHGLRAQRDGTVINRISKRQEKALDRAVRDVYAALQAQFPGIRPGPPVRVATGRRGGRPGQPLPGRGLPFPPCAFVDAARRRHPQPARPRRHALSHPHRRKNQGTNDLRREEGKATQAKGNAIERLGKNVIGFRAAMLGERIFPFVCFGDGCDFADGSSILDRVVTIAMFGELNREYLHNQGDGRFGRGSFYFREAEWTQPEMYERSLSIAEQSVRYYFGRYGRQAFVDP